MLLSRSAFSIMFIYEFIDCFLIVLKARKLFSDAHSCSYLKKVPGSHKTTCRTQLIQKKSYANSLDLNPHKTWDFICDSNYLTTDYKPAKVYIETMLPFLQNLKRRRNYSACKWLTLCLLIAIIYKHLGSASFEYNLGDTRLQTLYNVLKYRKNTVK